ncbi:MAG: hypothetical protein ACRC46_12390 [Thermoguttaceae bacterium]
MRTILILGMLLGLASVVGCLESPPPPESLGTILTSLPSLAEAEAPYHYPYGDHTKCKFSDDPFGP